MSEGILYYPYINVPDEAWFTRLVLYWDRVGAIVPASYMWGDDKLQPHMRRMVEVDLVERVVPEAHELEVAQRLDDFLAVVDADIAAAKASGEPLSDSVEGAFEIHEGKVTARLGRELVQRGVARPGTGPRRNWWMFNDLVGARFMSFLAAVLAESSGLAPITDTERMLVGFAPGNPKNGRLREAVEALRPSVLNRVLAAPLDPVAVDEIVAFKDTHGEQLRRFRNAIDEFLLAAAQQPDDWARQRMIDTFVEDAQDEVKAIQSKMKGRGWKRTGVGALLVAAPVTAAAAAIGGPTGGAVVAAAAVPGAVYRAAKETRAAKDWRSATFAYAALAEGAFVPESLT